MFDGALLDVAIGMLLIFFVSSLVASAIVEAVGGFLHRRSKHLWDTLDLLLGNTSTEDGDVRSIVDELYRQPFITGLVRPTDRARFDPATNAAEPAKVPLRANPPAILARGAVVATRVISDDERLRRYYGPINIAPREFTNSLLAVLRPQGRLDEALVTLQGIRSQLDELSDTDVALADIDASLSDLRAAADAMRAREITDAIDELRSIGERVDVEQVRRIVSQTESAFVGLITGDPTREQLVSALGVVPHDLRIKLLAVLNEAGEDIVRIRSGIEDWYERTMSAASSWYRKQTRWFLFLAGLVMAVSMNVDAVGPATRLYRDDATRDAIVALADDVSSITCATPTDPASDEEAAGGDEVGVSSPNLVCVRDELGSSLALPVGWGGVDTTLWAWVFRVLGWITVAGAVTVGAPFWFDLLGRALRMRGKNGRSAE